MGLSDLSSNAKYGVCPPINDPVALSIYVHGVCSLRACVPHLRVLLEGVAAPRRPLARQQGRSQHCRSLPLPVAPHGRPLRAPAGGPPAQLYPPVLLQPVSDGVCLTLTSSYGGFNIDNSGVHLL